MSVVGKLTKAEKQPGIVGQASAQAVDPVGRQTPVGRARSSPLPCPQGRQQKGGFAQERLSAMDIQLQLLCRKQLWGIVSSDSGRRFS